MYVFGRYEMLQDNVESYRKEISTLREHGQKMAAVAQKNEQAVNTLTQEINTANEKINMAEVSVFVWCLCGCRFEISHCKATVQCLKSPRLLNSPVFA